MEKSQATGGIEIFLFGAVTSYLSLKMPLGTFRAAGTGLFPLGLGILLMILSGFFVVRNLRLARTKARESAGTESADHGSSKRVVFFIGTMALATILLRPLGYLTVSFLLLLLLVRGLGGRGWVRSVLLSFFAALISYLLFVHWLKIPLPRGWIGL